MTAGLPAGNRQERERAAAELPVEVDEDAGAGRGLIDPRGRDLG